LVRIQFLVFVLNFSFKAAQTQLIIRIFRVLHTVQSSVFKVLFVLSASGATRISYHLQLFLSTIFFIFFKAFSSFIDVLFEEVFAAVFSGELYHTKAGDKSQHLFTIFLEII